MVKEAATGPRACRCSSDRKSLKTAREEHILLIKRMTEWPHPYLHKVTWKSHSPWNWINSMSLGYWKFHVTYDSSIPSHGKPIRLGQYYCFIAFIFKPFVLFSSLMMSIHYLQHHMMERERERVAYQIIIESRVFSSPSNSLFYQTG